MKSKRFGLGRAIIVILLLFGTVHLTTQPSAPEGTSGSSSARVSTVVLDSIDIAGTTYLQLLREQLSSENPVRTQRILNCEIYRIFKAYGDQVGQDILDRARSRAFLPSDSAAQRRIDGQLANKVFGAHDGCQQFAREGLLGGAYPR